MQKIMIASVLAMTIASAAAAQGMKVDFDGSKHGATAKSGSGLQALASYLEAATADSGLVVPEVHRGVTPVNGPGCYGNCPGEDPNGDDAYQEEIEKHRNDPPFGPPTQEEQKPIAGVVSMISGSGLDPESYHDTLRQSGARLATATLKKILLKDLQASMAVKYPAATSNAVKVKELEELEVEMTKLVAGMLQAALRHMQPYSWDSKYDTQNKLDMIAVDGRVIARWEAAARDEAVGHRNWQEIRAGINQYQSGPAYQQLGDALLGKEWFTSEVPH